MNKYSEFLDNIADVAKSRLTYPWIPKYEIERLNTYINPVSIERAKEIAKTIPWITNYIFLADKNQIKKLLEDLVIIEYSEPDDEDKFEFERIMNSDEQIMIWTTRLINGNIIWEEYATDEDWILNSNIIYIKL